MKRLLLILSFMVTLIWFSFWANNDNDCSNISVFGNNNIENKSLSGNKMITREVYNQALIHLKQYCNWGNKNSLETNIFSNQLLNIAFRRIDGVKGLGYGVASDEQGKTWRSYLNGIEKEYNTLPDQIYKTFEKSWGTAEQNTWANTKTLYGKYKLVCKEIKSIYEILTSHNTYIWIQITPSIFYTKCMALADKRYRDETRLVKQVMFQNNSHRLNDTLFKAFNQTYWKQLWDLYDKFMVNLWNYDYAVRRFIKVTDANTY